MNNSQKLQLGCFDYPVDGWINTDVTPHLFLARVPYLTKTMYKLGLLNEERYRQHEQGIFRKVRYLNVTKPFPFASDSIDFVHSSHMLEHIPKGLVGNVIKEIHRVLRSGGVVRTAVPDLDHFIASYDPTNPDRFVADAFQIEARGIKNRHHWMYNRNSLTRLFAEQGFQEVKVCGYREGKCADLELLDNRPDESLYVEALKP
jgi:predicted SAM-dependent methyltransferase